MANQIIITTIGNQMPTVIGGYFSQLTIPAMQPTTAEAVYADTPELNTKTEHPALPVAHCLPMIVPEDWDLTIRMVRPT